MHTDSIMMDAVHTSETSVHSNKTTRRYITEDFKLQFATVSHKYLQIHHK